MYVYVKSGSVDVIECCRVMKHCCVKNFNESGNVDELGNIDELGNVDELEKR